MSWAHQKRGWQGYLKSNVRADAFSSFANNNAGVNYGSSFDGGGMLSFRGGLFSSDTPVKRFRTEADGKAFGDDGSLEPNSYTHSITRTPQSILEETADGLASLAYRYFLDCPVFAQHERDGGHATDTCTIQTIQSLNKILLDDALSAAATGRTRRFKTANDVDQSFSFIGIDTINTHGGRGPEDVLMGEKTSEPNTTVVIAGDARTPVFDLSRRHSVLPHARLYLSLTYETRVLPSDKAKGHKTSFWEYKVIYASKHPLPSSVERDGIPGRLWFMGIIRDSEADPGSVGKVDPLEINNPESVGIKPDACHKKMAKLPIHSLQVHEGGLITAF